MSSATSSVTVGQGARPAGSVLADGLLLLVAIFWGSSYVAAKSVVASVPVFVFLAIRFALTSLMLAPLLLARRSRFDAGTVRAGVTMGVLLFLVFSCETLGVAFTTPSNAGLLISLCVVLTPLLQGLVLRTMPRLIVLVAAAMSSLGAALLSSKQGYRFNQGDLLILGAAFLRSGVMIVTKRVTAGKEFDSGLVTVIQLGTVALLTAITRLIVCPTREFALPVSPSFWTVTLYLCLCCTIFAFYVQTVMIRRTTPTRVGLLMGMEPVFATAFAVGVWGKTMTTQGWVGGALIIAATYLGIRAGA